MYLIDLVRGSKAAAIILLGVNVILLCGSAFILIAILLKDSPELYGKVYNATNSGIGDRLEGCSSEY
jgi:hypothetical protein